MAEFVGLNSGIISVNGDNIEQGSLVGFNSHGRIISIDMGVNDSTVIGYAMGNSREDGMVDILCSRNIDNVE